MDTGENLELVVETQAEEADRDLDKLIDRLGEVIEKLKSAKNSSQRGLIPGLEDDMKNLLALRSQISKLNISKAGTTPDTKQWKAAEQKIAAANTELEKFKVRAKEAIASFDSSANGNVLSKKIEDALANQKIYGLDNHTNAQTIEVPVDIKPRVKDPEKEARNKQIEEWFQYDPMKEFTPYKSGIDTEIDIQSTKDLAFAQKRLAALENTNKRLEERIRAAQDSGNKAAVSRESSKIRQNERLMSQYADAIERAEKAQKFMAEAGSVQIIDVEDLDAAEKAAEKLRKAIESDTASMRKFSAANDASGVDRMRAKIDAAYASLNEYDKAIQGAGDVAKIRENQRALADLQKEMEKLQSKIAGRKSGNMSFINNTATVRRLKIELAEAQMRAVELKRALGDITVKEAAVTRTKLMAKHLAMNAVNAAKLNLEARHANRTFINMARALQLMAFRAAVRTVIRLTKEGIQNLAQYSKATDNAFNGSMSRMMSSVSQMKNAFATAMAPIIQMIEPYVVKVINLIIRGVNTVSMMLAYLFGQKTFYKARPLAEDYAKTLDKTAGKAKELKRQLMGFDELNVLNDPNSKAAGANAGQTDPKDMFTIENMSDHMSEINEIKKKLEDIIPIAETIGGAIAAWKLGRFIDDLLTSNGHMELLLGTAIAVGGAILEWKSVKDIFKNGIDLSNFIGTITGGAGIISGASLIGAQFGKAFMGAAIGAIAAGVPMFVSGIYSSLTEGITWMSAGLTALGSTLIGAGIGFLIGGPLGAGIGALVGFAAGALVDLGIYVSQHWEEICNSVSEWWDGLCQAFSDSWEWTKQGFSDMWESIKDWGSDAISGISEWWDGLCQAFSDSWEWTKQGFSDMWEGIKEWGSDSISDIKDKFSDWGTYWSGKWEEFKEGVATTKEEWSQNWDDMKGNVKEWYETNVKPWFTVEQWKKLGSDALDALWSGLQDIWKDLKDWWSELELPEFKIKKPHISWGSKPAEGWIAKTLSTLGLPTSIPKLNVSWYANGGFPSAGELFIAREAGPEMVGKMGGRTAVANNDQIVEGIASGVSDANKELISVVYAVTQQVVQAIKDKDSSIYLDRDRVGQMVTTTQNQQDRMYGR